MTSATHLRDPLFRKQTMAQLFLDVLYDNRRKDRLLLHEFVAMPDHFHLIITPAPDTPLEKALQYFKGGFSFRAKKELRVQSLIWQESFTNHRIRDGEDYQRHRDYIHRNPVDAGLVKSAAEYPYSSASPGVELDPVPPWLKPES